MAYAAMDGLKPDDITLVPPSWTAPLDLGKAFGTDAPLEVDLGCGKGRFLLARAQANPGTRFLGVERQLRRVRKVARKAARLGLANVRVLRCETAYTVRHLIAAPIVQTYYVFFPDPWPKRRHHKRRLFTAAFVGALADTLRPGGRVHLATDHREYFDEMSTLMRASGRFDPMEPFVPTEEEQTDFERVFLGTGATISRASFALRE